LKVDHPAWSPLIAVLLLICIGMVWHMSEQLDDRGTGQFVESGGVRTERVRVEGGDPETLDAWALRHRAAVAKFEVGQ